MNAIQPTPVQGPHLRLALVLGLVALLATLAVFPYLLALMPQKIASLRAPLWVLVIAQSLQAGVIAWLLAWLGLAAGARHGLDAPWLRSWVYGTPRPTQRNAWWLAAGAGFAAGIAVVVIHASMKGALPSGPVSEPAVWRGALASLYGGTAEEFMFRLGVMSVLVWLLAALRQHRAGTGVFVAAIVIAALLFGAGHLPAAAGAGMQLTGATVATLLLLNGVVGVVCGLLYWRKGLEHAMLAHFCADLVLHVITPALG